MQTFPIDIQYDLKENMSEEMLASICKALSHPIRLKILSHLKREDRCICGEIVEVLPLSQSTVSQHLKCLKDAGLIHGEMEGPRTCYCLNKEALADFKAAVQKL